MGMGTYKKKAEDVGLGMMMDMNEDEDEAMWNELDATDGPTRVNGIPTIPTVSSNDDDHDMGDVIREMDNKSSAAPAQASSTSISTGQPVTMTPTTPEATISEAEVDWEDMYL
jgi:hypothetical protein